MKTYKRISIVASLAALLLAGQAPTASAASNVPYDTYTYSYDGRPLQSPHAYVPEKRMSGGSLGTTALAQPEDLFIDSGGRVYIADTGNNRILVLDEKDVLIAVIEEFGGDRFNRPTGVFVTQDGQIYVADRGNKRILEFNTDYTLKRTIPAPEIAMLPDGFNYDPTAITVDKTGRIYVLSTGSVYGVITLTSDGKFDSFLGSQRVSPNLVERFWRLFMSDEQKRRTMRYVPTNYNNMAMDADGFLYLTAVHSDTAAVAASIAGRSTSDEYASVKKLNYYGDDVLERQGFYPPAGDVKIVMTGTDSDEVYGPSNIIDVSLDANGSYSLADDKRNKIFTYDEHGNLLYVFGGTGYQLGQFQKLKAVAYKDGDIYALDSAGNITAFTRTEYGSLINEAIRLARDRKYEESVAVWEEVLLQNGNFDMAILGIGDAYYRAGDYESAMECYQSANAVSSYSNAFKQYRKETMGDYVLLIPLAAAVLVFLLIRFFAFAKSYNAAHHPNRGRYGFSGQLMYGFHVIFRPFDGFWDMKHEKRGGLKGAAAILVFFIAMMLLRTLGYGYIFNPNYNQKVNILGSIAVIVGVLLLWCISNWCLTSLMNGKGKFTDIFVSTCYCLLPMAIMTLPAVILSHFLTQQEAMFIHFCVIVGAVWSALLLISAVMTIHDYSLGKNLLTILFTLVGMVLIAFVGFLFINLLVKIYSFIVNIYNEITFRM